MKKIFLSIFAIALLFWAKPAIAQYQYQTNEEVNQIVVDKTIKGLDQAVWKDNYSRTDMVFKPGTQFEFQIVVKNTGNRNLTQIQVKDVLPASLSYIFGRNEAALNNLEVTWTIPEIRPGEEQKTIMRVKVLRSIPVSLKEWTNFVEAKAESGAYDSDTSAFWTVDGASRPESTSNLPVNGATDQVIFGSLISVAMIGVAAFFRKYARGY